MKEAAKTARPAVLVVDDERAIRDTISEILGHQGYQVDVAEDGVVALERFRTQSYDVVLCDIKMPKMDGIEVLEAMLAIADVPVIMISGHGTLETAVDAIKRGAFDYIEKPLDLNRLLLALRNAIERVELIQEARALRHKVAKVKEIIGQSPQMQEIKSIIERVAPTSARVLITGENGTGKELVARQLHALSGVSQEAFVEVNCAAIPSELIESELFGHEKGAFTSAVRQRKGKFELADGGTLFLDEVGDMSLSAQSKVLRALQENKIVRVGGDKEIPVAPRVIAATNKDIRAQIAGGEFREDLYHRLSVILIHVPPLRDRTGDIPLLISSFIESICRENGMALRAIDEAAVRHLSALPWSGNVRELHNVVERLIIMTDGTIRLADVERYVRA